MPGQRLIPTKKGSCQNEKEKQDNQKQLLETLLIVTGFIFAGFSTLTVNEEIPYLQSAKNILGMLVFMFVTLAILLFSANIFIKHNKFLNITRKVISYIFSMMLIFFFIINGTLTFPEHDLIGAMALGLLFVMVSFVLQVALNDDFCESFKDMLNKTKYEIQDWIIYLEILLGFVISSFFFWMFIYMNNYVTQNGI
ncbi:hypothetical protein [Methanolobus vulcani]|uniref:Uncharacterized protein n=1 Tax=Methanolobus vulcani TaxID=38026 RepID=A0A7Z8KNQ5_9EURY|nr:hypothetical protein [Methanolobus vulcani]TQD25893.1 hypothetical protein FKV42_06890 [Methanolobus vulcani]